MIHFDTITLSVHQHVLLEGTSLHIGENEKVVMCGPSGSGKSSLLKAAVGILPLAKGTVMIGGLTLSVETVAKIRAHVAFIGQEPVLGAERVEDALLLPFAYKAHRHNRPSEETILRTLERLRLTDDILSKPSNRISGGEKQRIAIARALLLNKQVFLADETTSALDPESKAAVIEALFQPGITLLSVSHDPDWIAACERIVEIADCKLMEVGGGQ